MGFGEMQLSSSPVLPITRRLFSPSSLIVGRIQGFSLIQVVNKRGWPFQQCASAFSWLVLFGKGHLELLSMKTLIWTEMLSALSSSPCWRRLKVPLVWSLGSCFCQLSSHCTKRICTHQLPQLCGWVMMQWNKIGRNWEVRDHLCIARYENTGCAQSNRST